MSLTTEVARLSRELDEAISEKEGFKTILLQSLELNKSDSDSMPDYRIKNLLIQSIDAIEKVQKRRFLLREYEEELKIQGL